MKAPSPPPTMPMRSLRFHDSMTSLPGSAQAEDLAVGGRVAGAASEIIEGHLGRLDEVPGDERRSLGRSLFGTLDAALPFHDRPAVEAGLRQQREHLLEVHLPV